MTTSEISSRGPLRAAAFILWLVAAAGTVHAAPTATDSSLTDNEDAAPIAVDLSTYFTDPIDTIVSYAHLSSGAPAVANVTGFNTTTGQFTFTPIADANGSQTFTFEATNSSAVTGTFDLTLTLNPVNDPPSFTAGPNQTIPEDSGSQIVDPWASMLSAGPANENTQALTFSVTNDNNALFSTQPSVDGAGRLSYTPGPNANGVANVTVRLTDDGGGTDTSPPQVFTITITQVNDTPSFAGGSDQTVAEDAGPITIYNWAKSISKGAAFESGQTLTFNVTNSNTGLFSAQPSIDPVSGDLTYTSAPDANGVANLSVTLSDDGGGANTSPPQTFSITVTPVNDTPSFSAGADQTVAEDAGAQTVSAWAIAMSVGPANESAQTLTFNITNSNTGLFSAQPSIDPVSGDLTYTPAPDANGIANLSVTLSDDGGGANTSAPQTFSITVTGVNDTPSFSAGADQTVAEDAGAQTVNGWATGMSAGPANESGQTLTFNASNDNNTLFSSQPTVDAASGDLTFTPAPDANGVANVTVTLSDNGGGAGTTAPQTFSITVTAVNDTPSFSGGTNQTVAEDAGAQTVSGWATGMSAGPADESGQTLTFNASNDNNTLFSAQPTVDAASGDLTYTPAPDANGVANVTVTLSDSGGGAGTSAPQTFSITVTAVNDTPSFTAGPDQSVAEDAGPQTASAWATGISKGPADESGQTLTFNVSNDNNTLFSAQPAVDPVSGDLTYTPAPNLNGVANVTVTLSDSGGGASTSAPQVFTISVGNVNDPPSFSAGADETVPEDAGPQTVVGWATGMTPGPADESGQTLTFNTSNDNNTLFSSQPSVDAVSGDLTYTTAADANGVANVSVTLSDDGGGANTSPAQTFTITVNPVNDAPSFTAGPDQGVPEDAGPQTVSAWATSMSPGPADEAGQILSFNATNDNSGLFSAQPGVDPLTGDLTYTPAPNANGTANVTVTLSDDGGGANTSPPQTFVIAVGAVNDPPSFTAGSDQTVVEDAGAVTISGWATGLSAGPTDESGQVLTFNVVANTLPGLFSAGPTVDGATGDLTFTPAPDANGSASISLTVSDDGGGTNTSGVQSFTIDVTPVNDEPSFLVGSGVTVAEDTGPHSIGGVLSSISAGPANESGQLLTLNIVGNSNPGMFSAGPNIDLTGTLTFDTVLDANGTATISVQLSDDGGTANGGDDLSPVQTFDIVVTPVSDMPLANGDSVTMVEDTGPIIIDVLANDYLGDGPTTIVQAGVGGFSESTPTSVVDPLGTTVSDPNGQVTIISGGTQISYDPKPNFYGPDTFTYTINDKDGDAATATVTINVTGVNDPPQGVQLRTYSLTQGMTLIVDATNGLLVGSYDVEDALVGNSQPLSISPLTALPTGLTLDTANGTFTYTPPSTFTGTVSFDYRLDDGTDLSTGSAYRVEITVNPAPPPPAPPPAGQVAIPYNLSNVPLEQSTSVPPNVLVVMDDSGSMDWNLVVAGVGEDGGFLIDNSARASYGRHANSYVYMWDLPSNAYPPYSSIGRILATEAALQADSHTNNNEYGVWRGRNHLYNRLYYNPEITYTPWIGQDDQNQAFGDAVPTAIRLDPVNPGNTFNMLASHSYTSWRVPEWDSNGGTQNIPVNNLYIPRYYTTTATAPLQWDDPHTLIEICQAASTLPDGSTCSGGPLPGGMFPGGPNREDCAVGDGNPLDCTYAQEIQNFANYFQYYRAREYVAKNGIGKVVSQVQDIRVGYETISNTTSQPVADMNSLYTTGAKKALMDTIYSVNSFGGTPLRQALRRAGEIFSCNGSYCPALAAPEGFCQQNFALLFSDGYWNGGTGVSGNRDIDGTGPFDGGRYEDGVNATLADVAMYYYENDLQPGLTDDVPLMRRDVDGVPPGTFTGPDPKMHQHMKTYTIAFGVTGTVDPATVPLNPATAFSWPDPFSGTQEKIDDMLHTAVNGRGNFLNASDPQSLQAAFEAAFLEFTQAASSTSSAAFNSTSLRSGTLLYRGFYDLRDNTGELTATIVNPDGTLQITPTWYASKQLNPSNKLPSNRVIVTFDPATNSGIPFQFGSLTPSQQATLNAGQVDYLRGVRTSETTYATGTLRSRPPADGLLGDIVNSSPVFVGDPRAINRDQSPYPTSTLYSTFSGNATGRTPVVYVGSNDGMMHGFNALTGDEIVAYVPNKILDSSQSYANSLDEFTSPFYQHNYYVDLTPRFNDVWIRSSASAVNKSWNTVLVGGLGAGGKGFYALNVTDPDTGFISQTNAAGRVMWEFTDEDDTYPVDSMGTPLGGFAGAYVDPLGKPVKDLGYALSLPSVVMSNVNDASSEKEWVAIFGNGPNSTAGIAKLFVLFMDRGLDGWQSGDFVKMDTGFGVPSTPHPLAGYPNGLGTPAIVDRDLNGTADLVYAGDRLGNLFRFDLTDPNPSNWTVTRLFTAGYDTGSGITIQPILAEPLVIKHPTQQGFLVIFGTGSYQTRADADSEDIQSIYAIWDRGSASPVTAQAVTKQNRLVEQTITNVVDDSGSPVVTRRVVTQNAVNYQPDSATGYGTYGWYVDLDMPRATSTLSGGANPDTSGRTPPSAQFPGEKAIRRLLFRDGTIITTTVLPSLDEFSCLGPRPGSILVFDALTGGDAGRPVVDFNNDGVVDNGDLVGVGGYLYSGGLLFNQSDLDGALVDLSTLGGSGDTDFLFVSGGNDTVSFRIENINDSRTGRLSWREVN